ncbi:hypothetical protein M3J09_002078 [Ascochyta lentis]
MHTTPLGLDTTTTIQTRLMTMRRGGARWYSRIEGCQCTKNVWMYI